MAIVQVLNESYFCERFKEMGRGDQFSYEGLQALYSYYDQLSDDTGEDIQVDVVAICCDWYEGEANDIAKEYDITVSEDDEDIHQTVIDYLEGETTVIDCGTTILYAAF